MSVTKQFAGLDTKIVTETVRDFVRRIGFHHVLMFTFTLVALAMSARPNEGLVAWFTERTGIAADWLVVLFMIGAFIFANDPGKRWFVLAFAPLIIYGLIQLWNIAETNQLPFRAIYFLGAAILFPIALRFGGLGKIRIVQIYAACMVFLGLGLFQYPHAGTAEWIQNTWGLPGRLLGFVLIAGGLPLALRRSAPIIIVCSAPFIFYLVSTVFYASAALGTVGVFIAAQLLICVLWFVAGGKTINIAHTIPQEAAFHGN